MGPIRPVSPLNLLQFAAPANATFRRLRQPWARLPIWPHTVPTVDRLLLWGGILAASIRFLLLHAAIAPHEATPFARFVVSPGSPPDGYGWWSWWDQGKYLESATAWAHGALSPALHWYLPGYPLLAAPFVWLGPADPFLLPDLACFIASLLLFARLASRLLGRTRHAAAIGVLIFVATSAVPPLALVSWVLPWTTTPTAVCLFGGLLAAARFLAQPRPRDAFLAAFAGIATAWFRPAEAVCFIAVAAPLMATALHPRRDRWPTVLRSVGSAIAGATLAAGSLRPPMSPCSGTPPAAISRTPPGSASSGGCCCCAGSCW